MREIKFRVFEPVNGGMHYVDLAFMTNDGNFILPSGSQDLMDRYTRMNLDAVKIMQYTGLKDKNGKEIYEGDIVQFGFEKFLIEWQDKTSGYKPFTAAGHGGYEWENIDSSNVEIIGNIYENPELLKC